MKADAETNAAEDQKKKEEVSTLNEVDALMFQTEKQIEEFGDKLDEIDKTKLESVLKELKEAIEGKDMEAITTLKEKLTSDWNEISTKLYETTQEGDVNEEPIVEETATDVEYEEVKE